jgi:dTDP-4-amino-4,6-dideoxygalactose transaminase
MHDAATPQFYQEELSGLPEISLRQIQKLEDDAWHLYPTQLNPDLLRITRDQVIRLLHERHIGTSVHFIPLHLHPFYQKSYGYKRADFTNASCAYERLISLPLYLGMSEADVRYVIAVVHEVVTENRA